ncbi:MAG: class II fructose-bisphosphate aldolase [Flavobacteriales bacterium AspAUS03]
MLFRTPIARDIQHSKTIVNQVHQKNISVEDELSILSGVEKDMKINETQAIYTRPDEAERFISETRNGLSVAVDTSHGTYKLSGGK